MAGLSLADRVEVAIAALQDIGDATWDDLHPASEQYSAAEKAKITLEHTETVRKLSLWQDIIAGIPLDECNERMFYLEQLLNRRVQEASSIIMSLSLVN